MAAKENSSATKKSLKSVTIKRKWRHAKKKKSQSKNSKNYEKKYKAQGR